MEIVVGVVVNMPFTIYHLGVAILLGYPLRRKLHYPTFILANVVPDIEPFLVFTDVLRYYPLHGYLHTFVASITLGALLGYIVYLFDKHFAKLFELLKLVENSLDLKRYIVAGSFGWFLHVLMDSPIYSDIKPLFPLQINPFYGLWEYPAHVLQYILIAGLTLYLVHLTFYYIREAVS